MKRIGILGGSFDPVHIGHTALANYICETTDLDEVWLTLSPQNPLKTDRILTDNHHRLAMLSIATGDSETIKPCAIELELPIPSYTITTLNVLAERYTDCEFRLIIGSDNWLIFDRWKDYKLIIEKFGVIIYPRGGYDIDKCSLPERVTTVDAPKIEVSSSMLRKSIADGLALNFFFPSGVYNYIMSNHLYQ